MGAEGLGSRAIIGRFFNALDSYLGETWLDPVSIEFQSDQPSETYKWLGQVPAMREWVGGKHAKGFRENGLTIENKEFESTIELPRKWLRRDKTGQINVRINELAQRASEHWQKLLTTLITNGTGSTSGLAYDGQFFFDDDHTEGLSGTQKNLLTSTEVASLDVTTAATPTAAEASKAILGVISYMMTIKDDQGEPMNHNAKNWLVMTSPVMWQHLAGAIYNPLVGSGASNPLINIGAASGLTINVVANPGLAYTTQFATFRVDAPARALIRQNEVPISMKALGEGSDHTFDTGMLQFSAEATRNVGYGYWQYASHSTFS